MHAAALATSPRLQRLLAVLADGRQHSSLELVLEARVCAISAAVSELRMNGAVIDVERFERGGGDGPVWLYRLVQGPHDEASTGGIRALDEMRWAAR